MQACSPPMHHIHLPSYPPTQGAIKPCVVSELSPEVEAAFSDARIVALDVEGVDLSRIGVCPFFE